MRSSARFLLALALVGVLASSAQTAPTEAQPQSQVPSTLTKPATPACPPPCLTGEQEAALVEVRKILKEARQVAEGITPPNPLFTTKTKRKGLEDIKGHLFRAIEDVLPPLILDR